MVRAPALAAAGDDQVLPVPLRVAHEEVVRAQAAEVDAPVVVPLAVVEVEGGVAPAGAERAGEEAVVDLLRQVHRDAVDPDLQRDVAPAREVDLAAVGTGPRPRRVHDRREPALGLRHREDAVEAARALRVVAHVLEADVVDVDRAGRELGLRREPGVDRELRELLLRRRPERVEVRRVLDRGLDLLRRVGGGPDRPVLAAVHRGGDRAAQEAGLLHRAAVDRPGRPRPTVAVFSTTGGICSGPHATLTGVPARP